MEATRTDTGLAMPSVASNADGGAGIDFALGLFILILAPEFYLPLRQLGQRFHAGMSGTAAAARISAKPR